MISAQTRSAFVARENRYAPSGRSPRACFSGPCSSSVDRGRALSPRGGRRRFSLARAVRQAQPGASAFFPSSPCRQSGTATPRYPVRQSRRRCIPRLCRSRNVPVPKGGEDNVFDSPGNPGKYGNQDSRRYDQRQRAAVFDTSFASRRTPASSQGNKPPKDFTEAFACDRDVKTPVAGTYSSASTRTMTQPRGYCGDLSSRLDMRAGISIRSWPMISSIRNGTLQAACRAFFRAEPEGAR
jgi:hypothetical protein